MILKLKNNAHPSLRLFAFVLAVFFSVLAVFDGLEAHQEIEYYGEFVDEAEFDYVEFPTSISRPSGGKSVQSQRLEVVNIFENLIFVVFSVQPEEASVKFVSADTLLLLTKFIKHTVCTNAP